MTGFQQDPAAASDLLSLNLRSHLAADYEGGGLGAVIASLRLSVFKDALIDQGLSPKEAEATARALEEQLLTPVPTATARDFEGLAPFTATPTITPTFTPTNTATNTPTRTNTPVPTRTPTKTPVPPTKPPSTPKPTATSSGGSDSKSPQFPSVGTLTPPPGSISTCTIQINNQRVTDAAPSSGIKKVRLKYYDPAVGGYRYSSPLTLTSGGMSGGAFDGTFSGSITVGGVTAGDSRELYVIAEDNAGNTRYMSLGWYDFTVDCP